MTTTVTVKTHDWPVAVSASNFHNFRTGSRRSSGNGWTEDFQPANSEKQYTVTDTQSVTVRELHKDATSLDHHDELTGNGNTAVGSASL